MLKIDVIAAGRLRKGPLHELSCEYIKRTKWPLLIHEVDSKATDAGAAQRDEEKKITAQIKEDAFVIVLDERGKSLGSADFAKMIAGIENSGKNHLQFIIGGADGHTDNIRTRADFLLCFGRQTWPHLLARVMLMEQIYRAQQILAGHPYHRE